MQIKELLKGAVEGTGEISKDLMGTVTGLVREGTTDIGQIFHSVIELGKEGIVDVTEGVRDVFVGSVRALEESGKTTEEAVGEVTTKAAGVISAVGKEGMEDVGSAARKGVEEAKSVVKKPLT